LMCRNSSSSCDRSKSAPSLMPLLLRTNLKSREEHKEEEKKKKK
jgi:hypothetical protein